MIGDLFAEHLDFVKGCSAKREYCDISKDMFRLWNKDRIKTIKLIFYVRMIDTGDPILENEWTMSLAWMAINHKDIFIKYIPYWLSIGNWKDLLHLMFFDLERHGYYKRKLPWEDIFKLIHASLLNTKTSALARKYLPNIRSESECNTFNRKVKNVLGKEIAKTIYGIPNDKWDSYELYRKLRRNAINPPDIKIDLNTSFGLTQARLVGREYLIRKNLDKDYLTIISKQPGFKYNGKIHQLFTPFGFSNHWVDLSPITEFSIDKHFETFLTTFKSKNTLVIRDTSDSMNFYLEDYHTSPNIIAKTLALLFAESYIGDINSKHLSFNGEILEFFGMFYTAKYMNMTYSSEDELNLDNILNTLIDKEFILDEENMPNRIIFISDNKLKNSGMNKITNFREQLSKHFSKNYMDKLQIILWDITEQPKFENINQKDIYCSGNQFSFFFNLQIEKENINFINGFLNRFKF